MVDVDDDFELDFQGFKDDDESDIDEEDEVLDFDFRERFDEEDEENVFFFFFFFYRFFYFSFNSEIKKERKKENNVVLVTLTAAHNWGLTESYIDKN